MSGPARILIVGGGVAGMEVATGLARATTREAADITLADHGLSHLWKPMLHTFAAGTERADRQKIEFFDQARRSGFGFQPGTLEGIDRTARRVQFVEPQADDNQTIGIDYDLLVLSIGSRANDFGTKGVSEHCQTIDDLADAERFRVDLRRELIRRMRGRDLLEIAVVGGGATGVELAAELKRAIDLLAKYGSPDLPERLRLVLIESGPRLLQAFPDNVSQAATEALSKLGVEIRVNASVSEADAGGFTLKDGSRVTANLLVWAAGVKAPDALGSIEGLERSKTGQLVVGADLRTTRDPAIFAIGDCSSMTDERSGKPVPATAQAARQQAKHLVKHLSKALNDRRPADALAPFVYADKGSIVSLADYNGWATLGRYSFGGGILRGLGARAAHELLYRQHQFELLGVSRGALAWLVDALDRSVSPPVRLD